jgi:putative (di)nucleoside polyphosphate hydrolase
MNIVSLESKSLRSNVFRANVGILIINSEGKVLALERSDIKGAWQFPQGGIKDHEGPLETAFREVQEETNLDESNLQFIAEYPEWLAYELPRENRSEKYGRGQVQKWFLFRFTGSDTCINLEQTKDQEFSSWKWMNIQDLIKGTVSFRRSIYNKLSDGFSQYLAN